MLTLSVKSCIIYRTQSAQLSINITNTTLNNIIHLLLCKGGRTIEQSNENFFETSQPMICKHISVGYRCTKYTLYSKQMF